MPGSVKLRGGGASDDRRLDRLAPADWRHVERFPLSAAPATALPGAGAVLGVNWYSNFDEPQRDGRVMWIGRGDLGRVRGGHAIFAPRAGSKDTAGWWAYYDQGEEGRCVQFACMRCASHLWRLRLDADNREPYWQAQREDEYPGGSYPGASPVAEGTSVRAELGVWQRDGLRSKSRRDPLHIAAYRWMRTWDEVREALAVPDGHDGVPLLNSWGRSYPHTVRITDEAGARLLAEDGEAAVPSER